MFQKLLLIALAGSAGALARYGLGGLVQRWTAAGFPWGTAVVNAAGCFLFGLIWTVAGERTGMSEEARVIILVGFVGAFTTFSTFIFDTHALAADARWLWAAANVGLHMFVGVATLLGGVALGRVV